MSKIITLQQEPLSIIPTPRVHRPDFCTHLPADFLHTGDGYGIESFTKVNPRVCSECGAVEGTEEYRLLATHPTLRVKDSS